MQELLGAAVNISDADVASWADVQKRSHREQSPWHYVDIPADESKYNAKRDGRDGDNVIDKINLSWRVLADKSKPKKRERTRCGSSFIWWATCINRCSVPSAATTPAGKR